MNEPPRVPASQPPVIGGTRRAAEEPIRGSGKLEFLLEHRWAMFGMLFCVTGAVGLPLLWRSSKFTRQEKLVWSAIVSVYTLLLLAAAVFALWWAYQRLQEVVRLG